MAILTSLQASSQRRTDELDDYLVLCGGIKDRWFLRTRNLEGGANIRTITDTALYYRTLLNGLGSSSKTEAVAISDGYRNDQVAYR